MFLWKWIGRLRSIPISTDVLIMSRLRLRIDHQPNNNRAIDWPSKLINIRKMSLINQCTYMCSCSEFISRLRYSLSENRHVFNFMILGLLACLTLVLRIQSLLIVNQYSSRFLIVILRYCKAIKKARNLAYQKTTWLSFEKAKTRRPRFNQACQRMFDKQVPINFRKQSQRHFEIH